MKQTLKKLSTASLLMMLLFSITPIISIASEDLTTPSEQKNISEDELSTSIKDTPLTQIDEIENELEEEIINEPDKALSNQQLLTEEIPQKNNELSETETKSERSTRSTPTVTNYAALKAAIESGAASEVILGANIELTGVINLPPQNIIINGNGYQLTQRSTTTYLSLPRGNTLHIELKNMQATAKTYYGILYIADICTAIDLTINQVNFRGPQLAYNRRGTLSFAGDNQIYIESTTGGNLNQEVAEVMDVIFKADTTTSIHHASSGNAAFWLGGVASNANKKIVIEDRAAVDIVTNNTLSYANSSSPSLTLGKHASFTLSASEGSGTRVNQISTVTIGDYSSLTITDHPTTNSNVPLLKVETAINVGLESTLDVQSTSGRTNLIYFSQSGGSITATNPKYVNFSNNGTNLLNTTSSGTLTFSYSANNVNHWARPLAGKLLPSEIWSNPDNLLTSVLSIKGTSNNGTTGGSITSSLIGSNIPSYAPSLQLYEKFSVGNGAITMNEVGDSQTAITGLTTPNAFIIITYPNQANKAVTLTGTADSSGQFSIATTPIKQGTKITAYSAPLGRAMATTETIVKDLTPPTANPVTQLIPVGTSMPSNPRDTMTDLKDNISSSQNIQVTFSTEPNKQPNLSKIGLSYAYVLLEDEAHNSAEIKVPVFVTSGDTRTSANTNEAIYGEDFTIKQTQVTGNAEAIKALIFNHAKVLAWDKEHYLTKDDLTFTVDPNLTDHPADGTYEVKLSYGNLTHTIYVTVLDAKKLISVKIPVKMLFGSMDVDAGNIHSPTYAIKNQSPFAVNVALQEIQEIDNDGLSLIKQGIPNQAAQRAKLDLSIEQNSSNKKVEYLAPNLTQPLDIATLEKENGQAKLTFSGFYYGDYQELLKPSYQFKLKFSPIE